MKKSALEKLSVEELLDREKSLKTLIGLFIPIILGLLYFGLKDFFTEEELNLPVTIITICTIGGLLTLFPRLKAIQDELESRF